MCGIIGFNWDDKSLVRRMGNIIKYRGPDQEGYYNDEYVSFGNKRLKIVDLSEKGRQPITNERGDLIIVFNGEIFNFNELRTELTERGHKFRSKTDTEVIIHAYEEYGVSCIDKLNGFFAFCIYDVKKRNLFIARDRIGLKPLYYFFDKKKFIFGSEIKTLLETGIPRKLNKKSMERFISFGFNFGQETMFLGINKLPPGHYLLFDLKEKDLKIKKYWSLRPNTIEKPESYFTGALETLLMDSVERRMLAEVPVGAYLSGGIDSSTVVGMMGEIAKTRGEGDIKTYCVGFGRADDELEHAAEVAEHVGTDHKEFIVSPDMAKIMPKIVWHSDDPIGDPAFVPIYLLTEKVRKNATVVLTGDGGDEFFAGYEQVKILTKIHKTRFIPKHIRSRAAYTGLKFVPNKALDFLFKHASSIGDEGKKRAISIITHSNDKARMYTDFCSMFNDDESQKLLLKKQHNVSNDLVDFNTSHTFFDQIMFADIHNQLPEAFCMKNDKMTMAHSVEMRTPILDHRIAEFSFTLPKNLKLNSGREKYLLRKVAYNYVPKSILNRKKQRFYVPIDDWLSNDLKPITEELLSKKRLKKQNLFDYKYVRNIESKYKNSPLFFARQLWNLLTFQIWYSTFIEEDR